MLDLKSGRITLHYDVTTDTKEKRLHQQTAQNGY
ncbi:hypothetical protein LTSERUB_0516, partial [Salmonella enterica subsp. enterica serovar Rubislaw str. A4-653]